MINIGIIGFGTVGTGTVKILLENRDILKERIGFEINLKKIADLDITRDRGINISPEILTRYIRDNGYQDIRPLVAFSGTVRDPESGAECTEPGMNIDVVSGKPISEMQLPDRFNSPDYHILLVANKYQTGFDQPLLHTMYVDKRLDGVQAVQTLSRLNRMIPGKDVPFVLDFVNNAEDIFRAFKPYYDKTGLGEVSDPSALETLKHELDQAQIYYWSEVEAFAQVFYKPIGASKCRGLYQLWKKLGGSPLTSSVLICFLSYSCCLSY